MFYRTDGQHQSKLPNTSHLQCVLIWLFILIDAVCSIRSTAEGKVESNLCNLNYR